LEGIVSTSFGDLGQIFSNLNDEIGNLQQLEQDYKDKVNKMENLGNDILKKADEAGNNDGKATPIELLNYAIKNPVFIILACVVLSIMPILDFIVAGVQFGTWDWVDLIKTLGTTFVALVFYIFAKASDGEYSKMIDKIKSSFGLSVSEYKTKLEELQIKYDEIYDQNVAFKAKISLMEYQLKQLEKTE
jgi:hypothetical protein